MASRPYLVCADGIKAVLVYMLCMLIDFVLSFHFVCVSGAHICD